MTWKLSINRLNGGKMQTGDVQIEVMDAGKQSAKVLGIDFRRPHRLLQRLLLQTLPVDTDKRVLGGDTLNDFFADAWTGSETGKVKLPNPTLLAYVMHQIVGLAAFAYESHVSPGCFRPVVDDFPLQ